MNHPTTAMGTRPVTYSDEDGAIAAVPQLSPASAAPNIRDGVFANTELRGDLGAGTASGADFLNVRLAKSGPRVEFPCLMGSMEPLVKEVFPAANPLKVAGSAVGATAVKVGDFFVKGIPLLGMECGGDEPMDGNDAQLAILPQRDVRIPVCIGRRAQHASTLPQRAHTALV